MERSYHTPVLVEEVLRYLPTVPGGIYVDGTLGGGGHAEAIMLRLSPLGTLVCLDRDREALTAARKRLERFGDRVIYLQENFANIGTALRTKGINKIHGLLLDLGVSSHQIDEEMRGFSFQKDSRLDMRMDQQQSLDAWTVVNTYSQEHLAEIFRGFGEEKHAKRIAKRIVDLRVSNPINTTAQLTQVVGFAIGKQFLRKSLARIFQAIRIEVNKELDNLRKALQDSIDMMLPGGRLAVISYHSLEDRIVKEFFRAESRTLIRSTHKLLPDQPRLANVRVLTSKPIEASEEEQRRNPRASSAKLRVAERV